MREIKFRVWDGYEMRKVWKMIWSATDGLLSFLAKSKESDHYAGALSSNDLRCKLMEFTGLSDKNGVEIYEGDIVHGDFYWLTDELGYKGSNYTVEYDNQEAAYLLKIIDKKDKSSFYLYDDVINLEVIGNIYENPELLEVNNDN
jgi:uncharacterized phage protein (TIGR01671 family)